jgi:hypothetical protein
VESGTISPAVGAALVLAGVLTLIPAAVSARLLQLRSGAQPAS